jgi:phosphate transport system permease protein
MTGIRQKARRARTNRLGVRLADRVARAVITIGGLGTIAAVTLLCVFLVGVVVPLFLPAELETRAQATTSPQAAVALGLDESALLGWSVLADGTVVAVTLADGQELARVALPEGPAPTVLRVLAAERKLLLGYADGSVRLATIEFVTTFLREAEAPPGAQALLPGESIRDGQALIERGTSGLLRRSELAVPVEAPTEVAPGRALRLLDMVEATSGPVLVSLADDDVLRIGRVSRSTNLLTGEVHTEIEGGELELDFAAQGGPPSWLGVTGLGDNVLLGWDDGTTWRCDAHDLARPRVAEKRDLVEGALAVGAREFLLGRNALLVGDDSGRLRVWFASRRPEAGTLDGLELVCAHEFPGSGAGVTALARSTRTRMFAAGYADGSLRLFHSTSASELAVEEPRNGARSLRRLALAPKDDAVLGEDESGRALWALDAPHPEMSLAALFRPVWYENFPAPEHFWQTTGDDEFEPKFGLVPLVFGTLKSTVYSLLFGVPLALLAALYTSEFLAPRHKARIKPTIEMMASLPSVVLGFLCALVLAPLLEGVVPAVLLGIALVPLAVVLGGHVQATLPAGLAVRLERWRLLLAAVFVVFGLGAAAWLGPRFEAAFFGGDFRQWLAGGAGGGAGGWMILAAPLVVAATGFLVLRWIDPALVRAFQARPRAAFARANLLKFLAACAAGALALLGLGQTLAALGFDPRGGLLDTYQQRNSLVVGFVMGFAIIPIVYTIAEDALAAVPDHLRAASLGAGATPWQTAMRIVLPTAMSGIFSAVMIGFGRAVGETMIVLMAAGSTPVLEWNVFNGFRTLSANIATEMPEAVRGSTHYRMLFLSALVLFALTSVLNTGAELVRLRYRRRRVQL